MKSILKKIAREKRNEGGESCTGACLVCVPPCIRIRLEHLIATSAIIGECIHGRSTDDLLSAVRSMTAREAQVFALALRGQNAEKSADTLGIGRRTVESHRSSLARRFGVVNLGELYRILCVYGLTQPIQDSRGTS